MKRNKSPEVLVAGGLQRGPHPTRYRLRFHVLLGAACAAVGKKEREWFIIGGEGVVCTRGTLIN